jgi:hypothetical protein
MGGARMNSYPVVQQIISQRVLGKNFNPISETVFEDVHLMSDGTIETIFFGSREDANGKMYIHYYGTNCPHIERPQEARP